MPKTPVNVTRGEVAELAGQVGSLQREVHSLIGTMKEVVVKSEEAKQTAETTAETAVTEDNVAAARRRFVIWGLILLLFSTLITIGVITTTVSECFLNQTHVVRTAHGKKIEVGPGGTWGTICGWIPGYSDTMRQQQGNLDRFKGVLGEIPKNTQENRQQDKRLTRIERMLGIKPGG